MRKALQYLPIVGAILLCELITHTGLGSPNPGVLVLLAITASAFLGGGIAAFVSAIVGLAYACLVSSEPGHVLTYSHENLRRLAIDAAVFPLNAFLGSALIRRARSEARSQDSSQAPIVGIFTATDDDRIGEANDAFLSMVHYSRSDLAGRRLPLTRLTSPEFKTIEAAKRRELATSGVCRPWRTEFISREGRRVPVLISLSVDNDRPKNYVCYCVDLSDMASVEGQLSSLAGRLLHIQDEERRIISRQLHDTTAQNLAALSMNLSILGTLVDRTARVEELLAECSELTKECLTDVRALSYTLHPPLLDELGLEAALRAYLDGFARRTGIDVHLAIPNRLPRLESEIESGLFRIVQERLTFLYRNAGTVCCRISVIDTPVETELSIHDNTTFSAERSPDPDSESEISLLALRERAKQIQCGLEVLSVEDGTLIRARIARN
jgi:PAS domain S-box-containing protein